MKSISCNAMKLAIESNVKSEALNQLIKTENIVVVKNYLELTQVNSIIKYLTSHISNTVPAYAPITHHSENFYRTNFEDPRAFIKGHFHQINFFPWNEDNFNFYSLFQNIFNLKNSLNRSDQEKFLNGKDKDFVPKISFQFYDSGAGFLERHTDPVGEHQSVVPILAMSSKGSDFDTGGLEVMANKEWIIVDDYVEPGDLILIRGDLPHGVRRIDPEKKFDLLSTGRWMGLFAINKVEGSNKAANSQSVMKN
jgi:hypothetical protein